VVGEDDALVTVRIDGAALPSVEASEGRFALVTPAMAEGTHTMAVTATDAAGNSGTAKQKVLVDSTERFGMATLGPGARGADARRLATLLRRFGGYRGRPASAVEPRIAAALRRFQRRRRLEPDGLAGPDVRAALLARLPPRIKIDLSGFRLTLYRGGILARSYPVAVGQDRYPTPRGSFRVIKKETNPAWDPPDAPWAAELDTIPPGPGNPLGTRWIGTSRGAIGIHGTYAEGSIGTRASHGCIRMRIADVEELFEEIELGTPIGISA